MEWVVVFGLLFMGVIVTLATSGGTDTASTEVPTRGGSKLPRMAAINARMLVADALVKVGTSSSAASRYATKMVEDTWSAGLTLYPETFQKGNVSSHALAVASLARAAEIAASTGSVEVCSVFSRAIEAAMDVRWKFVSHEKPGDITVYKSAEITMKGLRSSPLP
ncbi:MAG: hypothetical protein Q4B94_00200 [Pseudomonadota bacterium]|nr:hypothetical protein [Pseudomonadota bacterium]